MTSEQNKALYRHFVDQVINNGKYDEIPDLYTADYVDHNSPPGAPGGFDGVRAVFAMFRGAFPDVHFNIDEMVSEGDRVATRVTGHGTNTGSFMGMPPSGKEATWGSKGIFRVADGKIAEHWGMPDLLALLGQIGALPPEAILPTADTSGLTPRPDEPPADPTDAALLARNKAVVRRVYDDGFSRGDLEACAEIVASDYVDHPPARFFDVPLTGPASLQGAVRVFREGFPDLTDTVDQLIGEGNNIVVRSLWRGTHNGTFVDIPPTGKLVEITGINFFRLGTDGKIVERFGSFDALGMMQQMGLAPAPGGGH
jgi:steroid delta-isomerase-like uncharacterized protein